MNRQRLAVIAAVLFPLLFLFGPAILGGRTFAFRDAGNYYYPLFKWTSTEWSRGRIPLWNPNENCGVPVLADTTSSVLYPGKLLFTPSFLDFSTRYVLYVVLHVVLAAFGAYVLARGFGVSDLGAGLTAVSYALGGNVIFQHCIVVFLVGAAWLPFAFFFAKKSLEDRSKFSGVCLGAVLALMTLGGDPQAAYHSGILAALFAVFLWRKERKQQASAASSTSLKHQTFGKKFSASHFVILSVAGLSGLALASGQIFPAIEWTRQSDRAAYKYPRSIYEIPATLKHRSRNDWNSVGIGIFGQPEPDSHHDHTYHFSVAPWRFAELVWPNCFGRVFPMNHRWSRVFPADGAIWSPSLYMGLMPFIFGLCALRFVRGSPSETWLSWTVVIFSLGSLGWYGLGWLLHEAQSIFALSDPENSTLGSHVGGLYWLMATLLPSYSYFRFPAKLLVVASLGMSVLAGRGFDQYFNGGSKSAEKTLGTIAGVSGTALLASICISQSWWSGWLSNVKGDDFFGPFNVQGAVSDLRISLLHTTLLSSSLVALSITNRREGIGFRHWISITVLAITAIELTMAHRWMIATEPADNWQNKSSIVEAIGADEPQASATPYRVYRGSLERWVPNSWSTKSSRERLKETVKWERESLFSKLYLLDEVRLVESYGTMRSIDFLTFMQVAKGAGPQRPDGIHEPNADVLDLLSARFAVLPSGFSYQNMQRLQTKDLESVSFWRNVEPLPRAWIVHDIKHLPQIEKRSPKKIADRTIDILFPNGMARDFRKTAVVETDGQWPPPVRQSTSVPKEDFCQISLDTPSCVEIEVEMVDGGLIVLNDLHYPGWNATVATSPDESHRPTKVYRANRIMRGVYLPAGKHHLRFTYQPTTFWAGLTISAVSWFLFASWSAFICRRAFSRMSSSER